MPQMRRLRLFAILAVIGLVPQNAPIEAQNLPTRVAIHLLYHKDTDPVVAQRLRDWAESVDERIETSIRHDESLGMPRQGFVRAQAIERPSPLTKQDMEIYWRATGAIQVLFGRGTRTGATTRLTATVYLGELKGSLPTPIIPLSHTITPGRAQEATNMILAIGFYALGVDARSKRGTACILFGRSDRYIRTLPNSVQSAGTVRLALAAELKALGCGRTGR